MFDSEAVRGPFGVLGSRVAKAPDSLARDEMATLRTPRHSKPSGGS